MELRTIQNYKLSEVSSAMQQSIRWADTQLGGYWALELWAIGFGNYVWKRLLTTSAEDCWGIITFLRGGQLVLRERSNTGTRDKILRLLEGEETTWVPRGHAVPLPICDLCVVMAGQRDDLEFRDDLACEASESDLQ